MFEVALVLNRAEVALFKDAPAESWRDPAVLE